MMNSVIEQAFPQKTSIQHIDARPVSDWKLALLNHVAFALTDPAMPELQEKVGVWTNKRQAIYPSNEQITRLENGCLNFSIWVCQEEVVFSMWITHGEVRFGVKVPSYLLMQHSPLYDRISRAWDGTQCKREETIGSHLFFDWIWRNAEFADFKFMVDSTRDPIYASILADRLASLVIHIYLSVFFAFSDENDGKVYTSKPEVAGDEYFLDVEGDISALEYIAQVKKWQIRHVDQMGEGASVTVYVPYGHQAPKDGRVQDPDGGFVLILNVSKAKN